MKNRLYSMRTSRTFHSFVALIALILFCALTSSDFRKVSNFATILRQSSVLLILSAGLTAVLLLGHIDLSVGATAALSGCVCAWLLKAGVSTAAVLGIGLLIGLTVGALNGLLVSVVRLPSFVASYAVNWIVKGLAVVMMNGQIVFNLPSSFTVLGTGYLFERIPVIVLIALAVTVLCYFLYQHTIHGRYLYTCGASLEAARYSGAPIVRTQIGAFMMSGMLAGLGGLLMTARMNAAEASMADSYGLSTIAVVVLGGTSMLGGEGGICGTVVGAILLTVINNILNLHGFSSDVQPVISGITILAIVLLDSFLRKYREQGAAKRNAAEDTSELEI
ncbi:MAG: ABC transporter permease [Oscillospiraceae bacterium]|jgi:ribose transport system permease protein